MTKRFTSQRTDDYNFSDILDNGKWIGICHIDCEDDFVNKFNELAEENEQLKQQIKDLRIDVLDSIHEADDIKCNCNPCVVEEYVKKVIE